MTKIILSACLCLVTALHVQAEDKDLDKLVSAIDERISQTVTALEALAADEHVQSGDWDAMKAVLAAAQEKGAKGTYWFAWPNGTYCTVEKGLVGQTLSDRAYFPKVMSGKKVVGDLVVSRSTGKKVIVVTVPVTAEGALIGAVGASLFADELSAGIAAELKLPEGETFFALNADGQAALHSDLDKIFEKVSDGGVATKTSLLTGWRMGLATKNAKTGAP